MADENTTGTDAEKLPPLSVSEAADGSVVVAGVDTAAETSTDEEKVQQTDEDRVAKRGSDDAAVTLDDELKAAKTEDEREAIRARRREERQARRERRRNKDEEMRQALQARDLQVAELQQQVMLLSRRSAGTELAQIDAELAQAEQAVTELKDIIKDATATQQGEVVADATDRLVRVHQRAQHLTSIRTAFVENAKRAGTPKPQQSSMPDPAVVKQGTDWLSKNGWYDPKGVDLDSRIVRQIDDAIMAEGYDPRHPDYWEELNERVAQYLPHRAKRLNGGGVSNGGEDGYNAGAPDQKSVRRSAVAGSGREGSSSAGTGGRRSSFTLSPERVRALKDAGVWDDLQKRDDAIRRYQAYDTEQAAARR